jgi:hypothetical protein
MLFAPSRLDALLTELNDDNLCGTWDRKELEAMDLRFCEAVERGFANGGESRKAAAATVQVGRPGAVDAELAIESAWVWYCCNRDTIDIPFTEIVARCPGVAPMCVRLGFEKRLKQENLLWQVKA